MDREGQTLGLEPRREGWEVEGVKLRAAAPKEEDSHPRPVGSSPSAGGELEQGPGWLGSTVPGLCLETLPPALPGLSCPRGHLRREESKGYFVSGRRVWSILYFPSARHLQAHRTDFVQPLCLFI